MVAIILTTVVAGDALTQAPGSSSEHVVLEPGGSLQRSSELLERSCSIGD